MDKLLDQTIARITELDESVMRSIRQRQDSLTKPPGSLGVLEDLSVQIGGITGDEYPRIDKKAVVVMAGDHGVTAEGVSAFPSEVTPQMVLNFVNGGAAINVLSRHAGADVYVVDVGVAAPLEGSGILSFKVKPGTANMVKEPAMSRDEAVKALEVGIQVAQKLIDQGYSILATGEMGIGNTTASSALMAGFLGIPPAEVVGRGTGIDHGAVSKKASVIERALNINQPDASDPLDVLSKVGGLEIAALAGLIIGCAARRIPVVIDGFISTAAALAAVKLAPKALNYLIASHCSAEKAHRDLLKYLNIKPVLELEMRLGEGTGAVLAFHLIDASLKIIREMATFESAGVTNSKQ